MFRDYNTADLITRYLFVAAGLLSIFMVSAASYEVAVNVRDTWLNTWLEIVKWTGPSLGATTMLLIYWEVFNMIMKKIYVEKARKELNREWVEWNRKRDQARAEGREFTEPSPADRELQSERRT